MIELQGTADRAEAVRLLRYVRTRARINGDYVLNVRAWRNRAAIEAADRQFDCLKTATRSRNMNRVMQFKSYARMWDRVGAALEKGWDKP